MLRDVNVSGKKGVGSATLSVEHGEVFQSRVLSQLRKPGPEIVTSTPYMSCLGSIQHFPCPMKSHFGQLDLEMAVWGVQGRFPRDGNVITGFEG